MSGSPGSLVVGWVRLRALLGKEFLALLREPRMRFFVLVPPLIQLFLFGYAATFDVREASVGVVDQSRSLASRELVQSLAAGGEFALRAYPDMRAAEEAVDRSEVRALVRLPQDFATRPVVQLVADGSDSNSALLIVSQLSQRLRTHAAILSGAGPPVQVEERAWFNPNLDDRPYFMPGIIANVVLIATMILTAMTVVREREVGTLERLLVTPIGRFEFLIAKLLPVAAVGLFDVVLVSVITVYWFDVPFRGSSAALMVGSILFLTSSLGLGLLISTWSSTQQQAMLLAVFLVMPMIMLSGFAFPIRNMPEGVQLVTWLNPLRFYLVVIRDLFLKGGGLGGHLFEYGMMGLLGAVFLLLSALRLR